MASLSLDKDGTRRLLFKAPGKRSRRTIRLGRMAQRAAERFRDKVAQLEIAAKTGNPLDPEVAAWISKLSPEMYDKLAAAGMVSKRERQAESTLGGFLDQYITARVDIKPATAIVLGHTKRNLIEFFGAERSLREVSAGDADTFRLNLISQEKLSPNTVARRCSIAKQFFRAAKRRRLIGENPFEDLGACVRGNPEKFYFVSPDDAEKVLDNCPNNEWKLMFALSRFGGLRCPSEHLGLRWSDIDWERNRMRVRSPKTEHHEGKAERWVPLFPEVRRYLDKAFFDPSRDECEEFVITRYRDAGVNLRTQLHRIIIKAGFTPWPKTWQNLRSTRQTELAERFPAHVVCQWVGNSQAVAARHYLQVTDEHFRLAVEERAQKRAQNGLEAGGNSEKPQKDDAEETPEKPGPSIDFHALPMGGVGGTGLEPVTSTV